MDASSEKPASLASASAAALKRVGERQSRFLRDLIPLFLIECPELLSAIRQAIAARDASQLKYAAHTMQSSLIFIGENAATAAVHRLEAMGRQGNLANAEEACMALERALEELTPVLADFVKEPK